MSTPYSELGTGRAAPLLGERRPRLTLGRLGRHVRAHMRHGDTATAEDGSAVRELGTDTVVVAWAGAPAVAAGDQVDLDLTVDGRVLHHAPAIVDQVTRTSSATVLTLCSPSPIPAETLRDAAAHRELAHDASMTSRELGRLVPPEYRALCADMVACVAHHVDVCDRFDGQRADLRQDPEGFLSRQLTRLRDEWSELEDRADQLTGGLVAGHPAFRQVKGYTERTVTPCLLGGRGWRSGYRKSRGYAGDFTLMEQIYDRAWDGRTSAERLLHRLFTDHPVIASVRDRKDYLRQCITEATQGHDGGCRIMSVACGSARELSESVGSSVDAAEIVLLDQDPHAVNCAMAGLARAPLDRRTRLSARGITASFALLFDPTVRAQIGDRDLVYSAGLIDYLDPATTRSLIAAAYELLAPGGELIVANLASRPDGRWAAEFLLDWPLIYRSPAEMLAFAETLADATARVDSTPTAHVHFLRVQRR